ncbi:glutathione S-transferase C-terminal-like protein [Lentinula lateritia]|uniref:Glutathione S-transferase C-terminal-like protein n=1 Tax=Lentinula aff. lateritia TaxID=2804960 RepID=A0ACC1U8Q7_9AGAR|nr:glutathione S-transferase C-terminal-like protein [Lentinula aff. lateritia]KAJ3853270.1 glutathione S-transferase C-terminal-like protein [Lentinula lateritia]
MALAEPLVLYTAKICPFAHRVELALAETGLRSNKDFVRYEIDLKNKPEWYQPKINPASKVPAIAYGGPKTAGDQPSPSSTKIAESLVLLEFVADLFPNSSLLPKDPVLRAKTRFFIDTFANKFGPALFTFQSGKAPNGAEGIFSAIEQLQDLMAPEGLAIGDGTEFTLADAAVIPFFGRMEVSLKNDFGAFPEGEGKSTWETLQTDKRFARWKKYWDTAKARESFKATFDEDYLTKSYSSRWTRA